MKIKANKSIKALVLDIDGVLTDGTVDVRDPHGKRVYLRDLDALTLIKTKGICVAFLTGEDEAGAGSVVARCGSASQVIYDAKDKEAGLLEIARRLGLELSEICYVADGRRDVPALKLAGLALCPADGDRLAKQAANIVLEARGGRGAVSEAVDLILECCGVKVV